MTEETNPPGITFDSSRVHERSFHSNALNRKMPYMIVLPKTYAESQQRFPVLYLLHGWNGDHRNWCTLTHLVAYAQQCPLIIVTPDGQNSWYVNSATTPADRFFDYIATDLIAGIDAEYRTVAARKHRAIAGLSMGGYGSLLVSLKYPERFAVAGSISGAFDGPRGIEAVVPELRESIERAYGEPGNATRAENDLFRLIAKANPPLPYIFLQCGIQDALLTSNRRLTVALHEREIACEYHELPGDHTWEFWDASLPPLLRAVAERIVP